MSVRRLVASSGVVALTVAAAVLPAASSHAVGPSDVYVTATGSDNPDCSQATPCASVAAAISAADTTGTMIHVGPGTFDAALSPGALGKSVAIDGMSTADTVLTNSALDGFVLEVDSGTTSLSDLTVHGGLATSVLVDGTGSLVADRVVLENAACPLAVFAGEAQVTDSTLQNGGSGDCRPIAGPGSPLTGDIAVTGGSVSLTRTQVLSPVMNTTGVVQTGGTLTVDQSYAEDPHQSDNSHGIEADGGTTTVSRSVFQGWGQGVDVVGGAAVLRDSTFQGNVVGVNRGVSGSATVVRGTFQGNGASLQGSVGLAGSVLGSTTIAECGVGPVTDLGYNLAEGSCGLTQTTSHDNQGDLDLDTALAERGGPPGLPTVATFSPSPAVDAIPAGTTYGVSSTPLCAGTDLRGVPRPQAGACDAGSMELARTVTVLAAPATAKPHADVLLDATVGVPDVGVPGIEGAAGTVTFRSGTSVLCQDVPVHLAEATCSTSALGGGAHTLRATFTPDAIGTLHGSTVTRTIIVGTKPTFTSTSKATFVVGKSWTFRVRASGRPASRITLVKGKLPAGLSFHAGRGSATISGRARASAVGSRTVTVQAANVRGTARQVLRIVVTPH